MGAHRGASFDDTTPAIPTWSGHTPGSGGLLVANRPTTPPPRTYSDRQDQPRMCSSPCGQARWTRSRSIHRQPRSRHHGLRRPQRCSGAACRIYSKELAVGGTGSGPPRPSTEFPVGPARHEVQLVKGYQGSGRSARDGRNEVQGICLPRSLAGNLARTGHQRAVAGAPPDPRVKRCPDGDRGRLSGVTPGAGIVLRARRHGPPVRGAARRAG